MREAEKEGGSERGEERREGRERKLEIFNGIFPLTSGGQIKAGVFCHNNRSIATASSTGSIQVFK